MSKKFFTSKQLWRKYLTKTHSSFTQNEYYTRDNSICNPSVKEDCNEKPHDLRIIVIGDDDDDNYNDFTSSQKVRFANENQYHEIPSRHDQEYHQHHHNFSSYSPSNGNNNNYSPDCHLEYSCLGDRLISTRASSSSPSSIAHWKHDDYEYFKQDAIEEIQIYWKLFGNDIVLKDIFYILYQPNEYDNYIDNILDLISFYKHHCSSPSINTLFDPYHQQQLLRYSHHHSHSHSHHRTRSNSDSNNHSPNSGSNRYYRGHYYNPCQWSIDHNSTSSNTSSHNSISPIPPNIAPFLRHIDTLNRIKSYHQMKKERQQTEEEEEGEQLELDPNFLTDEDYINENPTVSKNNSRQSFYGENNSGNNSEENDTMYCKELDIYLDGDNCTVTTVESGSLQSTPDRPSFENRKGFLIPYRERRFSNIAEEGVISDERATPTLNVPTTRIRL